MIAPLIAVMLGIAFLIWGADRFISSAAQLAQHFKVPPLIIGLLVLGFGTSAPELVVSAISAMDGNPKLALGNALGSNIVNTGLVLGLTAMVAPIAVCSKIIRREIPLLILIGLVFGYFLSDGTISRTESWFLLLGFILLVGWTIIISNKNSDDILVVEAEQLAGNTTQVWKSGLWLLVGLTTLLLSSHILVWGAVTIAEKLEISSLVIGLTIVAFGTSLPELATSLVAARRGEHDMAVGNIIGSNMFNLLAVAGLSGAISPIVDIAPEVLTRDWLVMILLCLALIPMAYQRKISGRINRIEGSILVLVYVGYTIILIRSVV